MHQAIIDTLKIVMADLLKHTINYVPQNKRLISFLQLSSLGVQKQTFFFLKLNAFYRQMRTVNRNLYHAE